MLEPSSDPNHCSEGSDHQVQPCLAQPTAYASTTFPAPSASPAVAGQQVAARTHAIRQVAVRQAPAGRLSEIVEDLDRAIQIALADGPRGVVYDLSAVLAGAEPGAVAMLATAGRHVRDWPGIPVAMSCPDPRVRERLCAHPLGGHLIVTASMLSAVSAVLATPIPAVERLRLAPHPTAPRASREFVTRTLLGWGLGPLIPCACLVVSELVTNSTIRAGTDIGVSVEWNLGALRLRVRDNSPDLPRQQHSPFDVDGRGLSVVAGLSRAFGVLPTAEGGKVVWAVLNTARPRPPTSPHRPEPANATQDSPMFADAPGPTGLAFSALSSQHQTDPRGLAPVHPF